MVEDGCVPRLSEVSDALPKAKLFGYPIDSGRMVNAYTARVRARYLQRVSRVICGLERVAVVCSAVWLCTVSLCTKPSNADRAVLDSTESIAVRVYQHGPIIVRGSSVAFDEDESPLSAVSGRRAAKNNEGRRRRAFSE